MVFFSMCQPTHFFGPKGVQGNFFQRFLLQHKKRDRNLLGINYLCVAKMKYRHLTPEQRYRRCVTPTKNEQKNDLRARKHLPIHPCRELKRNSGQRGYHHEQAQVKADDRKRRLQNYRNLTIELRKFIRERITQDQWSPAQIVGHLRKMGKKICVR